MSRPPALALDQPSRASWESVRATVSRVVAVWLAMLLWSARAKPLAANALHGAERAEVGSSLVRRSDNLDQIARALLFARRLGCYFWSAHRQSAIDADRASCVPRPLHAIFG